MRHLALICLLAFSFSSLAGQDSLRTYQIKRTTLPVSIDGIMNEAAWNDAEIAGDFIQNQPYQGKPATERSEVKLLYNDLGLYIGATLYDNRPDSILHELGIRDAQGINADHFRFVVDPYNKRQDAFDFGVYASGVQTDSKFSDETFDAIWYSSVKIHDKGWTVEMMIPYAAIRFPDDSIQEWGLQLTRTVRRTREFDQWALTPNGVANGLRYWGTAKGISNIKSPLRLSLIPFVSAYYGSSPIWDGQGFTRTNSFSYTAGADVKYGIDDRFTLDMTLFPDFGQVQSDNKVKNLSYQEVTYNENRTFFKEGTELFSKGNLFYSRRIGKTPSGYYSVPYQVDSNHRVVDNPSQVRLLNAAKLSGRTNNGLGIGLFNAITDNMYATVEDEAGKKETILTEPLTNFNIFVIDQQFKNNKNLYFINTNVTRSRMYNDANVTGAGFETPNKKNTWGLKVEGMLSQKFSRAIVNEPVFSDQIGYNYFAGFGKISGNFQMDIATRTVSKGYDARDLGFFNITNFRAIEFSPRYNIYVPNKILRNSFNNLSISHREYLGTGHTSAFNINWHSFSTLHSFNSIFFGGGLNPFSVYDYYEPRVPGRYWKNAQYMYYYYGLSSDYRKKLAVDLTINHSWFFRKHKGNFPNYPGHNGNAKLRYRFNDHLTVTYSAEYGIDPYNPGFATFDSSAIIFGGRTLETYINGLSVKYIFVRDMILTINARHYWNTGKYIDYFTLLENGDLEKNPYDYNMSYSTNFFNVDIVYSWIFSPGSMLSINYKNAIEEDTQYRFRKFQDNLKETIALPQTNTFSIRLLYFLDYQHLKRIRH